MSAKKGMTVSEKEKKHKTNTEFVMSIMEFSKFGAISQVFVIEAINDYTNKILNASPEQWTFPLISFGAWQNVAKEIKQKLELQYNGK